MLNGRLHVLCLRFQATFFHIVFELDFFHHPLDTRIFPKHLKKIYEIVHFKNNTLRNTFKNCNHKLIKRQTLNLKILKLCHPPPHF